MATSMSGYPRNRGPQQGRQNMRQNNYTNSRNMTSAGPPRRNNGASNYGGSPGSPSSMSSGSSQEGRCEGVYNNSRMISGLMHMVGQNVRVTLKTGKEFDGILGSVSATMNIELKEATVVPKDGERQDRTSTNILIQREDYLTFTAAGVDISGDSFTDKSISGRVNGQAGDMGEMKLKELQPWDSGGEGTDLILEHEATRTSNNGGDIGWDANDMFEENRRKFKVQTDYDVNLSQYTMPIPKFKTEEERLEKERIAEAHARDIEKGEGYRQRVEAENNPAVDEETKYSSVVRPDAEPSSGRYVPPNRRPQMQQQQQPHLQQEANARHPVQVPAQHPSQHPVQHPAQHPAQPIGALPPPPSGALPQREHRDRDRRERVSERSQDMRNERSQDVRTERSQDARNERSQDMRSQDVRNERSQDVRNERSQDMRNERSQDARCGGDRGWENRGPSVGRGMPGQVPQGPQMPPSPSGPMPTMDRMNGTERDRRPDHQPPPGRTGYISLSGPRQPLNTGPQPQRVSQPQTPPHLPPQQQQSPMAHPVQNMQMPMHSSPQVLPSRSNQPGLAPAPVPIPVSPSHPAEGLEGRTLSPQSHPVPAQAASIPGMDKKSPREKETRPEVSKLKQFQKQFNCQLPEDEKKYPPHQPAHQDRRPEADVELVPHPREAAHAPVSQGPPMPQGMGAAPHPVTMALQQQHGNVVAPAAPMPPQAPLQPPVSHQPPPPPASAVPAAPVAHTVPAPAPALLPAPPTTSSAGTSTNIAEKSILNPQAPEFKPKSQPQPPPHVSPAPNPAPAVTPPAGLRQSPGIAHHPATPMGIYSYHHPLVNVQPKMVQSPTPQQQSRPNPKRAIVSVDTVAQNVTGPPLQLAAQTPMQQPYVYQMGQVLQQGGQQYHQMPQMQAMVLHPSGSALDPNQGGSSQQARVPPQFLVPQQQPMPAHMQPTQAMPQPAHTLQHHHMGHMGHMGQHSHPSLPPVSQNQNPNTHPHSHSTAASPVQHMGPNGVNHGQGAPPTSGTPQPQLAAYQQSLPPQGSPHGMPAHSVASALHTHFMPHHQMQQSGMNLSQAGGNSTGGPAPAHLQHLQHSGAMNQQMNVVVMPQPPPQAINQTPHPPHTHHQHAAAAAQFHQQLAGASQMHGGVGPNQHILQGNMGSAAGLAAMPQHMQQFIQTGVQTSHAHPHQHAHSHPSHHSHFHQPQ